MDKRLLAVAVGTALLGSGTAMAAPFNSFDPRSMAMGGAGTGVANAATAAFFNPSLLSVTDANDDFAMELPILGARVYDPNEFVKSLDNFQSDRTLVDSSDNLVIESSIANADAALAAFNAALTTYQAQGNQTAQNLAAVQAAAGNAAAALGTTTSHGTGTLAGDTIALSNGFSTLSDKQLAGEAGGAIVIGIPSKKVGAAVVFSSWNSAGAVIRYRDDATLNTLATDTYAVGDQLASIANCTSPASCQVDYAGLTHLSQAGGVDFVTSDLNSSVSIRGISLNEVGIGLSREVTIGGQVFSLGFTPKYVKAVTFDYVADVNSANQSNMNGDDYTVTSNNFNLDLGISKDFGNAWRAGFVVKNVIAKTYDFKHAETAGGTKVGSDKMKLNPQARIGVSYQNSWMTAAMDADLTENNAVGFEDKTRYIAIGTELNAANWAQLRLGYRADTVNNKRSVGSAGIGLSPFGVHIDVGVAGNAYEIGGAFQLGVRF